MTAQGPNGPDAAPGGAGWAMVHKAVIEDRRLTKAQRLVYTALCAHAYRDQATASYRAIAETAQVHRVTAIAALRALRDCGHVTWKEHTGSRSGRLAHTYTIAPLTAHYAAREANGKKGGQPVQQMVARDYQGGRPTLPGWLSETTRVVAPDDHPIYKDQEEGDTQDETRRAPAPPDLTPALLALYQRLMGQPPPPAIAEILAQHLADVGEMKLSAMLLESHGALGVITPGSLTVARRKLDRSRRGNVIRVPPPAPRTELPPLPDETNPIYRAILEEMRHQMTRDNFTHWFAPTRVVAQDSGSPPGGETLTVGVPSELHARYLTERLGKLVSATLRRLGYDEVRIVYTLIERAEQSNA